MQDIIDLVTNVERIYDSNTSFKILKDFERVLDDIDIYVYKNWEDGELCYGPDISKYWVKCAFMWPYKNMPDPMGAKRLLDYDCKVTYKKDFLVMPRKIKTPDDVRPGTKKGKLKRDPIWVVEITMPKKLLADLYAGYASENGLVDMLDQGPTPEDQPADEAVAAPAPGGAPAPAPAPAPQPPAGGDAPGGQI